MASSSAMTGRGIEEVAHAPSPHALCERPRQRFALGVHSDRQTQLRRFPQSVIERRVVRAWKLRQARIAHERLEADHTAVRHLRHLGHRARHESAPQTEVGNRCGLERCALAIDLACVDTAWR